ncbi:MAG TPA: hypothetical protein VFM25_11240, partial [Verrucomicrobiae bacterium]|nr:hypothetical protein [Verrucomicrobiae bacterium]
MKIFPAILRLFIAVFLTCAVATAISAETNAPATGEKISGEKMKPCFQCHGTGKMKCPSRTCKDGETDCPGPCLKLTKGTWVHMNVAGHPATDVWQKFRTANGWQAYNQGHVGHVIKMVNGMPTDVGVCPICHGTTKVKCPVCKGTGVVVCDVCEGKKEIPESWSAFDNPKMKDRPSHFKMKDGAILIGRRKMIVGDETAILTETGM